MSNSKLLKATLGSLLFSLVACQPAQVSSNAPAAKAAAPEQSEKVISTKGQLVVKAGGQTIAYYLDGSAEVGRFLLPNGLTVKVNMWSGDIVGSAPMMYSGAGCSGIAGLSGAEAAGIAGQVVIHLGHFFKLTGKSTQAVNSFNMSTSSAPNCQNTSSTLSSVEVYSFEEVSPSELPDFAGPVALEYDN